MTLLRPLIGACLGTALLATSPFVSAMAAVPQSALFAGAVVDIDDGSFPGFVADYKFDTTVAEVLSAELGYHSKAASDFGINKAYSKVTGGSVDFGPFAYAVSAWADSFTLTGGTGNFTADVSVTLSGQFGSGMYSEAAYGLFAVSNDLYTRVLNGGDEFVRDLILSGLPSESGYEPIMLLGNNSIEDDHTPGSFTDTGHVHGTFGESVHLVSVLVTYAEEDGEIDMFHTAVFGITGPAGSTLTTGSGTSYTAAVPEPGTYALFAAGLVLLAAARRKAHRQS